MLGLPDIARTRRSAAGAGDEQRRGLLAERPLADGPSRSHRGRAKKTPALLTSRRWTRTGASSSSGDWNRRAGDAARFVGREKHDDSRDLGGGGPTHRVGFWHRGSV